MSLEAFLLRLLTVHEGAVRWPGLGFEEVLEQAAAQVPHVFDDTRLRVLPLNRARGWPERGRGPKGYGLYYPGPPRPCYLLLEHFRLDNPHELRLAALFMEHLFAALSAAGYREELERQARTDWLTGLANRMAFERRLKRGLLPGWLLGLIDLDGLKTVNDQQGHVAGDRLLRSFGRALYRVSRRENLEAFRIGGDEFTVLLPEEAREKLEAALQGFAFSVGYARADEAAPEAICALADARMYHQKAQRKASVQ